jgi:hypothetical protein
MSYTDSVQWSVSFFTYGEKKWYSHVSCILRLILPFDFVFKHLIVVRLEQWSVPPSVPMFKKRTPFQGYRQKFVASSIYVGSQKNCRLRRRLATSAVWTEAMWGCTVLPDWPIASHWEQQGQQPTPLILRGLGWSGLQEKLEKFAQHAHCLARERKIRIEGTSQALNLRIYINMAQIPSIVHSPRPNIPNQHLNLSILFTPVNNVTFLPSIR